MTTEDTSPIEVQRNTAKERRKEWRVRMAYMMDEFVHSSHVLFLLHHIDI
jgi:hypothetical protein